MVYHCFTNMGNLFDNVQGFRVESASGICNVDMLGLKDSRENLRGFY